MTKRALITGVAGQDGSYLSELLLAAGYEVHGLVGGDPQREFPLLASVRERIEMHAADLTDQQAVARLVAELQPHELYNLAAPSVVTASWDHPHSTAHFLTASVTALLEAIRSESTGTRLFQATSSEIFRATSTTKQDETTAPAAASPYGAGKLYGHALVDAYRRQYGLHASSGVLYNHESPRRPASFVTRKITQTAAKIKQGAASELVLGSLDAQRDWSFAGDFVQAMWLMLQQDEPGDYVLASGELHSVREFVQTAFERLELDYTDYVRSDPELVRPGDDSLLCGDATKARTQLGWQAKVGFAELVGAMVDADLDG